MSEEDAVSHLSELNDEERAAFGALVQRMVHTDHRISFQESDALAELATAHGVAFWAALEAGAQLEASSNDALATEIRRVAVQRFTFDVLRGLAACDAVHADEEELLASLQSAWGL